MFCRTFLTCCLCLILGSSVKADVVHWTVQSSSSSLAISASVSSGGALVIDFTSQSPGNGASTTYHGAIQTNWSPTSLEVLSATVTANNSGNWAPTYPSPTNKSPANYGLESSLVFITNYLALRDLVFDFSSSPLGLTGSFAPDSLQTFLGTIDAITVAGVVETGSTQGAIEGSILPFVGFSDSFQSGGSIAYGNDLSAATLTIPVEIQFAQIVSGADTTSTADDLGVYYVFTGQIVATAVVPEASSLMLLGFAGSCIGFLGYRRSKR